MANSLITRITGWKKYFEQITGILIQGDPDAPPITWWNILWVRAQWKKAVILRIPHDKAEMGYRIGYWPMHGPLQLKIEVLHQQLVAVRLGSIGTRNQARQIVERDIVDELGQYGIRQIGIGHSPPLIELGSADLRIVLRQVEAAIGSEPAKQNLAEGRTG